MTKIEEVARVIALADYLHGGAQKRWNKLSKPARDIYIEAAKAAIAAMREPTVEMCEDGAQALEKYNPNLRAMREAFRAMIDRVLAEGGE